MRAEQPIQKSRIVHRATHQHRHHEPERLPAHHLVEHLRPFLFASAFGQGIEDQRLIRAAGHAFRRAGKQPVGQAAEKKRAAADAAARRRAGPSPPPSNRGRHDQRPAADAVRQHPGGQIHRDNGQRPGKIQQRVLRRAQAQIEKNTASTG